MIDKDGFLSLPIVLLDKDSQERERNEKHRREQLEEEDRLRKRRDEEQRRRDEDDQRFRDAFIYSSL